MKKLWISFGMVLICGVLGYVVGTVQQPNTTDNSKSDRKYAECIVAYNGFDDVLETADVIVSGRIQEIISHSEYDEYVVQVSRCVKGEMTDTIRVRNYFYDYAYEYQGMEYSGITNTDYETGEEYMFILQHIYNVYEDKYVVLSDAHIPLGNLADSTVLSSTVEVKGNLEEYIENYNFENEQGKGENLSIDYMDSTVLEDIVLGSQYIAEVQIGELIRDTEVSMVYLCNVKETIKGKLTVTESNQVMIPFFQNTVETGGKYIVLLNSDTDDSVIYTLSSKNSVRNITEKEDIAGILGED